MSAKSRREVLERARQRYGRRGREGRSRLLDEVCELCGYERKYAIKVLGGKRAIIGSKGRKRGSSQAIYEVAEREVIKAIWLMAEQPCGKRLKAALEDGLTTCSQISGVTAPRSLGVSRPAEYGQCFCRRRHLQRLYRPGCRAALPVHP